MAPESPGGPLNSAVLFNGHCRQTCFRHGRTSLVRVNSDSDSDVHHDGIDSDSLRTRQCAYGSNCCQTIGRLVLNFI
jgi:hypothetical protein